MKDRSYLVTGISGIAKIYAAVVLLIAAIFSRMPLSLVPIILLFIFTLLWLWPVKPFIKLFANYYLFFTLAILFGPLTGAWFSIVPALPLLALVNGSLEECAMVQNYNDSKRQKTITGVGIALPALAFLVLLIALLLSDISILLPSLSALAYCCTIMVLVIRRTPSIPVEYSRLEYRMIGGSVARIPLEIRAKTDFSRVLFVVSPYDWLSINPKELILRRGGQDVQIHISPTLAGSPVIRLQGHVLDRWGLIWTSFYIEPLVLHIIPRARYAEWLAKKYIEETSPGELPLMSDRMVQGQIYGFRRGNEYYSNRPYQPGDSLKKIDWKSSIKYHDLISREHIDFHGKSAISLINLSVANEEEADRLAFFIMIAALTLAHENIPTVLAAYNHEKVRVVTLPLKGNQLVTGSLSIAKEMITYVNPVKYLNSPDYLRLRDDIMRISQVKSEASEKLADLLKLELENHRREAEQNPATQALMTAFLKTDRKSNVLIISNRNHDAVALEFNRAVWAKRGNAVIPLDSFERKHKTGAIKISGNYLSAKPYIQ